jgi:hypothetical protein
MTNPKPAQPELHTVEPAPAPPAPETTAPPPDPFDLENLRLKQNFSETAGVKKLLRTVPVRKPNKQDFVRVHPDPAFRESFAMIELQDDREMYLIGGASLAAELAVETFSATLFTAVNRQGVTFLWPVRLPKADGKEMDWHRSMREAAEEATRKWIRVTANKSLNAYDLIIAEAITTEPQWPDVSFQELIKIAFRDRLITSLDHPAIRQLRGLI